MLSAVGTNIVISLHIGVVSLAITLVDWLLSSFGLPIYISAHLCNFVTWVQWLTTAYMGLPFRVCWIFCFIDCWWRPYLVRNILIHIYYFWNWVCSAPFIDGFQNSVCRLQFWCQIQWGSLDTDTLAENVRVWRELFCLQCLLGYSDSRKIDFACVFLISAADSCCLVDLLTHIDSVHTTKADQICMWVFGFRLFCWNFFGLTSYMSIGLDDMMRCVRLHHRHYLLQCCKGYIKSMRLNVDRGCDPSVGGGLKLLRCIDNDVHLLVCGN